MKLFANVISMALCGVLLSVAVAVAQQPTLSITSPANGATIAGTVTITTQIGTGVSWINVYVDGNYLASSPPLSFSWNSTSVPNGSHTIAARAYNTTGAQVATASVTVNVQNGDATPTPTATATPSPTATPTPTPAVKITAPINGASVSGTVSIVTQVSSAVSWINIYIDGNYFASSPPYTFSWNSTTVPMAHTVSRPGPSIAAARRLEPTPSP